MPDLRQLEQDLSADLDDTDDIPVTAHYDPQLGLWVATPVGRTLEDARARTCPTHFSRYPGQARAALERKIQ